MENTKEPSIKQKERDSKFDLLIKDWPYKLQKRIRVKTAKLDTTIKQSFIEGMSDWLIKTG